MLTEFGVNGVFPAEPAPGPRARRAFRPLEPMGTTKERGDGTRN